MALQPNLVLGAVGAAVFLLTGSIIVLKWRDLTGTEDYEATVDFATRNFGPSAMRRGTLPDGGTVELAMPIPIENVTRLQARVTWTESDGLVSNPHLLTMTIRAPSDADYGGVAGSSRSPSQGVRINHPYADTPRASSFSARDDALDAEFEKRYPDRSGTNGTWTFVLQVDRQGDAGISYTFELIDVDHYVVRLRQVDVELTK